MTSGSILLSQLIVLAAWAGLGTLLGVAGIFASSHIPVIVLGWIFGAVGACIHILLLSFTRSLEFWKVGFLISVIAGVITIVWAPLAISRFAIPMYFIFGSLFYLAVNGFINQVFLRD